MKRHGFLAALAAGIVAAAAPRSRAAETDHNPAADPFLRWETGEVEYPLSAIRNDAIRAAAISDHDLLWSLLPPPRRNADPGALTRNVRSRYIVRGETFRIEHLAEVRMAMPDGNVQKFARYLSFDADLYIEERDGMRHRQIRRVAERFYHMAHQQSVGGVQNWRELYEQRRIGRKPFRVVLGEPVDFRVHA